MILFLIINFFYVIFHYPISLSVFKCGERSCLRIYSSFDSFRKHIKSKHAENLKQNAHHLQQKCENINIETDISMPSSSNGTDFIDDSYQNFRLYSRF